MGGFVPALARGASCHANDRSSGNQKIPVKTLRACGGVGRIEMFGKSYNGQLYKTDQRGMLAKNLARMKVLRGPELVLHYSRRFPGLARRLHPFIVTA